MQDVVVNSTWLSMMRLWLALLLSMLATVQSQTACSEGLSDGGYCSDGASITGYWGCATNMDQDIYFLIDVTTNMDSIEFEYAKTFLKNLIGHATPGGTVRIGLGGVGSGTSDYTVSTLNSGNTAQEVFDLVDTNVVQTSDAGLELESSMTAAVAEFDSTSTARRVLVLIVAGESVEANTNPCSIDIKNPVIDTYVVALGDNTEFDQKVVQYKCVAESENDYQGLLIVPNIAALPDSDEQRQLELMLCPHNPLLAITEVQPSSSANVQYFELYNYGEPFFANELTFSGLFTGTHSSSTAEIAQGDYAVFYDSSQRLAVPDCVGCDCDSSVTFTTLNNTICNDAHYFGCGANTAEPWEDLSSGCAIFSAPSPTPQGVSEWSLSIDYNGNTIASVEYKADLNNLFVDAADAAALGYNLAYELKSFGFNMEFGSSWLLACDAYGTPGAAAYSFCSQGCAAFGSDDDAMCELGGLSGAVCAGSACVCGGISSGHYSYRGLTCMPLPSVSNCTGFIPKGGGNPDYYLDVVQGWDDIWDFIFFVCRIVSDTRCDSIQPIAAYGMPYSVLGPEEYETYPAIISLTYDDQSYRVDTFEEALVANYDEQATCSIAVTLAPTNSPTHAPTDSVDVVETCNFTISGTDGAVVEWNKIVDSVGFISVEFIEDYVYVLDSNMFSISLPDYTCDNGSLVCTSTLSVVPNQVFVAPLYSADVVDTPDDVAFASKTECTKMTLAPTVRPTDSPTEIPSQRPTSHPTEPSFEPSVQPSLQPSMLPSGVPSFGPSQDPTLSPSNEPTFRPSNEPSNQPSTEPSRAQDYFSTQNFSSDADFEPGALTASDASLDSLTGVEISMIVVIATMSIVSMISAFSTIALYRKVKTNKILTETENKQVEIMRSHSVHDVANRKSEIEIRNKMEGQVNNVDGLELDQDNPHDDDLLYGSGDADMIGTDMGNIQDTPKDTGTTQVGEREHSILVESDHHDSDDQDLNAENVTNM